MHRSGQPRRVCSSETRRFDALPAVFQTPIPLVYSRLASRFLTIFLVLLPFGLWSALGSSWNHWQVIPATFAVSFFFFGMEEASMQIEEPFSILPLEAMCNGAIAATNEEMLKAEKDKVFEARSVPVA